MLWITIAHICGHYCDYVEIGVLVKNNLARNRRVYVVCIKKERAVLYMETW